MLNRWSEAEATEFVESHAASCGAEIARLTYATRLVGADRDLAMHGGGNSSYKGVVRNLFGEERRALFIKGSGVDLAKIQARDFVALDLDYVARMVGLERLADEAMADEFTCHQLRPSRRRASVETLVHATLAQPWVIHTHPSAILALTNRTGGAEAVTAALGAEIAVVPYAAAGIELAHAVRDVLARRPDASALVLLHHGLVTWGNSAEAAYAATIDLVSRAEAYLERSRTRPVTAGESVPTSERQRRYRAIAPVLRGALGPTEAGSLGERIILHAALDAEQAGTLDAPDGHAWAISAPLTPDYLVRTKRRPLWLDTSHRDDLDRFRSDVRSAIDSFRAEYESYLTSHRVPPELCAATDATAPGVVLLPGIGMVGVGKTTEQARMAVDITEQALRVKRTIHEAGGQYVGLSDDHLFEMEFRAYQRAKIAVTSSQIEGTVALVTGAAGAIGSGVCELLLDRGCHVAATDLPGAPLDQLGERLVARYGKRVRVVPLDVTDATSIAEAFGAVCQSWGGVDLIVVNAGIAHVAPLSELSLEAFRRLERVNVEGTLLVLSEAARHFAVQKTGGDIVLVSTKNVFAPGAGFGAYSATKAAAHQLARVASLELAPLGVRVNMVAPDAVFSHGDTRSGLWAEVGPNRMKARGLDEKGLEDYYRSRNLLKAAVTADHVARAVWFFATHQTPTTGATIPVDGGLPDATPR